MTDVIDPATQAWIDAKHDAGPQSLPPDDPAIAGTTAAIAAARAAAAPPPDLFDAGQPLTPLDPPSSQLLADMVAEQHPVAAPPPIDPTVTPTAVPDNAPPAAGPTIAVPGDDTAMSLFDARPDAATVALSLRDSYVVPPFSILDTRQGYWQERRRQWLGLGIQSEQGRDNGLTYGEFTNPDFGIPDDDARITTVSPPIGTVSIFDPVLTEIAYRWLAPASGGVIVDPFAGGSVRGVIAAALGHAYTGVELRPEQVDANREQAETILGDGPSATGAQIITPHWICGDSTDPTIDLPDADLIFTCPPYADLEVYSDDPRDLSGMSPAAFDAAYRLAIARTLECLRPDRFACVVIGNVRDRDGNLRDLVGATISAFVDAGAAYYNEAILLNAVGTGAVRARKQFDNSRKLVRMHQTVLVFCNGNPRTATARLSANGHRRG